MTLSIKRLSGVYGVQYVDKSGLPLNLTGIQKLCLNSSFTDAVTKRAAERKCEHNTLVHFGRLNTTEGLIEMNEDSLATLNNPKAYPAKWLRQYSSSFEPDDLFRLNAKAEAHGRKVIHDPDDHKSIYVIYGKRATQYHNLERIVKEIVRNHGTPYDSLEGRFKRNLVAAELISKTSKNLQKVGLTTALADSLSSLAHMPGIPELDYRMDLVQQQMRLFLHHNRARIPNLKVTVDNVDLPKPQFQIKGIFRQPD